MDKNKQPFSQRHPKWNLLIGFILLLIIIALIGGTAYLLIKLISLGVVKFVEWTATLSSTLDAVVVVALITGAVSIIGVIISSVFPASLCSNDSPTHTIGFNSFSKAAFIFLC